MVDGWTPTSLGDILHLERRPVKLDPDNEYAEIGIYSYGRGIFHKEPRTGFEVGDKDLYRIKQGDFIFQITFAWEGAVGLASEAEDGMYGSVRFPTYRVNEDICYPPFLLNYFKTVDGRRWLIQISPGSAGRNRVLATKRLPEILVPLPPLTEQRRIVSRIEALAGRVEEARSLRQSAAEEMEAIIDAYIRKLIQKNDQRWEKGPLPNYAEINPSRVGNINLGPSVLVSFVPMRAVDDITGTIAWPDIRPISEVSKGYKWFVNGDVIFARITPCMENGKSAIARDLTNGIGFGSTEFHVIRPGYKILAEWIHALTRSKDFKDDAADHFKGTAGQQRVPQKFLDNKIIPVPPLEEQRRLVAYLDGLQTQVSQLRAYQAETQKELAAMMPSILDKAFKGGL